MLRSYLSSVLITSLAALLLPSCASRRTAATLNDVETYIQERPDSALSVIRAIDTATLTTRSLQAHYALLHAMALDKNWIDTTDVTVVMPAVEYYDRHPSGDRRAKAWYYLGRIQENNGDIPESSISFLKAEKYAAPLNDIAFMSLVYQELSNVYSKSYLCEEALRYTKMSYDSSVLIRDTLGANASLFRLAQDYNNTGQFAESDSLYRLLIYERPVHPNLRASLLCNYALNLVTRNEEYGQAASLFEEVIDSVGTLQKTNFWGAYAYALLRESKHQRANSIFKQLEAHDNDHSLYYKTWKSMADAFDGDYYSAYTLQKIASDIQTDNMMKVLEQSAIKAQKDFLEEINRESERTAIRRQMISWGVVILLSALIILLILYFMHRSKRVSQEKESLIEAYKKLTSQTEEEKAKVRNQYIQMCQSHFSHIGRINELLNIHADKESDNILYAELKNSITRINYDC